MAQKGFAVISGSNTVVAKILENGTVVFGDDTPVNAEVSGTLVLNLPLGSGVDGKVLQIGTANSASIAQLSASQIVNVVSGNLVATNVQDALNELQTEIDSISSNANLDVSSSAGSGSVVLASETFSILGDSGASRTKTSYDEGTNTLRVDLTDNVDLVGSLTASTGILVDAGGLTVSAGNISGSGELQVNGATTLGGTLTVNATSNTINGSLRVNGDLVVSGSTVTLEVQNLKIEDPIIVLGSSSTGAPLDGDRGLIFAQSASANDPAFGWDASDSVFRLGTTADDGTTPNLTIDPNATLELGNLVTTGSITVQNGLTVTGAVNLPNSSISNAELVNSSINISGGVGITVSGLESISLGGTGSVALALSELSTVTVDVATDSLAIVDASNSSASVLTTVTSLATGMAGTGLSDSAGTLNVDYGSTAGTAVEGNVILQISGTSGEINVTVNGSPGDGVLTLGSGGTLQIGLPDSVTITSDLTVGNNLVVSGSTTLGTDSSDLTTNVGQFRIGIFTVSGANNVAAFPIVPDTYATSPGSFAGHMFYLTSSAVAGSGSWEQGNKWYFNENGTWHASHFFVQP